MEQLYSNQLKKQLNIKKENIANRKTSWVDKYCKLIIYTTIYWNDNWVDDMVNIQNTVLEKVLKINDSNVEI